jgi:hypothetical protein
MVEQEVEQKTTEMGVLPGKAAIVAEGSRRHWTSLSMERRRTLTTPVKKKFGD